jgi:hypothetical protein
MLEAEREPYLFNAEVLLQLMSVTESMRTKLAFVTLLGPRLVDPRAKSNEIVDCFSYTEEREKVSEILKTRTHNLNSAIFSRGANLITPLRGRGNTGRGPGSMSRNGSLHKPGGGRGTILPTLKIGAASPRIASSPRSPRVTGVRSRSNSKTQAMSPRSPRISPHKPDSNTFTFAEEQENEETVTNNLMDQDTKENLVEKVIEEPPPPPPTSVLTVSTRPPRPPTSASHEAVPPPVKRSLSVDAKTFQNIVQREVSRRLKEMGAIAKPTTPENKTKGWTSPFTHAAESPIGAKESNKPSPLIRSITLSNDQLLGHKLSLMRPDECQDDAQSDGAYEDDDVDINDLIDEDEKDDVHSSPITRALSEVAKKLEEPSAVGLSRSSNIDDLVDASDLRSIHGSTSTQDTTPRDPIPVQVTLPQRISVIVPPRVQETVITASAEKVNARLERDIEPILLNLTKEASGVSMTDFTLHLEEDALPADHEALARLTRQDSEPEPHPEPEHESEPMQDPDPESVLKEITTGVTIIPKLEHPASLTEVEDEDSPSTIDQQSFLDDSLSSNEIPMQRSKAIDFSPVGLKKAREFNQEEATSSKSFREDFAKQREKRLTTRDFQAASSGQSQQRARSASTKPQSATQVQANNNPRVTSRSISPATSRAMLRESTPNPAVSPRLQAVKSRLKTNPDRYISPARRIATAGSGTSASSSNNNPASRSSNRKAVSWNDAFMRSINELENDNAEDEEDDMNASSESSSRPRTVRQVSQGLNNLLKKAYSMRYPDQRDNNSASQTMDMKMVMSMAPADPVGYDSVKRVPLFSYIEIVRRNYCKMYSGINHHELEKYIVDEDFVKHFGMSKVSCLRSSH